MNDFAEVEWRTGRKVGRTIYVMVGDEPSDDDVLVGMMDTRKLAEAVVREHNICLHLYGDEPDDGRPRRRGYQ